MRTGDTSSAERALMVRRPPSFVVTTPESLYLLVTSGRGREALRTVETVIVDEIHAVARDKRGAHLALTLERLEALCARRPARIGLSATQRPIETVGRLLVGDRPLPSSSTWATSATVDLALELPDGELEAVASAEQMADVLDRIAALVVEHRTTLVFVNTRRLAERLAHQLGERLGDDVVAAHHGSLSKERRHRVETRLRAGDLKALVATASLELGIDIGPVELVCQIGSPRSIATFLQRVGPLQPQPGGHAQGPPVPPHPRRAGRVQRPPAGGAGRPPRRHRTWPACRSTSSPSRWWPRWRRQEWRTDDLFDLVRRAAPYTELDPGAVRRGHRAGVARASRRAGAAGAPTSTTTTINGELRARKGARLAAVTSGGAIPETGDYRVVAEPDDTFIGTVNEDWAVESMAGDIFLLGTHSWQIRRIEAGVVRVRDAGDTPAHHPVLAGRGPGPHRRALHRGVRAAPARSTSAWPRATPTAPAGGWSTPPGSTRRRPP